jgi:hypothetical protein
MLLALLAHPAIDLGRIAFKFAVLLIAFPFRLLAVLIRAIAR